MYSVVIVGGDEDEAQRLRDQMDWKKWNCTVLKVETDGITAYEKIRQIRPQIIITEIELKSMNGLELIQKLEEEYFSHSCIVVSAFQEFKWAQKAIELGVKAYLLKPVDEEEMERTIKKIVKSFQADDRPKGEWEWDKTDEILKKVKESAEGYSRPIRSVLSYVETNLYTSFTMSMMCDHLRMNQSYISRLFKKEAGVGFADYLRMRKMSRAKSLLRESQNKVYQVALLLGYQDYNYFYKIFKSTFGYPPTALRAGEEPCADG